MTKVERIEFLQEIKEMMEELLDQKIDKAVNKAVDKAVDKAVNKAVDKAVDSKINIAIEKAIAPLREEIRDLSRAVAVIEVEHGRKLDILFDAFTMNSEKHEENKKRIISCERKLEKHEGELFYLKSKLEKA